MKDGGPEFMTVPELAELLRIKERKVYDLAASGQVPCSRATGKLLFPSEEIRAWIGGHRSGPERAPARPCVFLGSHDPLLSWALGQSGSGLASYFDGSLDGLARFRAGEGVATGLHVREPAGDDWNVATVERECADLDAVLVSWAVRRRGLVVRPETLDDTRGIADLAGRRIAARQAGSGTEVLLGSLLEDAGLSRGDVTLTQPSRNESDAVLMVLQGAADVALGLETIARQFGLAFRPVLDERFDILVDRRSYFEPPLQRLLAFMRGAVFSDYAATLGGYDIGQIGEVRWNSQKLTY